MTKAEPPPSITPPPSTTPKPNAEVAAPPVVIKPKKQTPYTIVFKNVETVRGDGNRIAAKLHCQFTDPTKDSSIYGIGWDGRVVMLDTGTRKIPGAPWGYGGPRQLTNYGAEFTVTTQLEDNETKIAHLDGMLAVVRPGPSEMVEFTDLGPQAIGKAQSLKGYTFTLAEYKIEKGIVITDTIIKFPPDDPLRPNIASDFFWYLKYQMMFEGGAILKSAGGSGGGLGDGRHHYDNRFPLGAAAPKAFQISFVPRVEVEEVEFSLNDIDIPRRDIAALPAAPLKRGARSVKSEEFTFSLEQVELKDGNEPSMDIAVIVHPPPKVGVIAMQFEMTNAIALDDKGSQMKSMGTPWMMSPFEVMHTRAHFRHPDDEARTINSFKGTFEGYVKDEETSQEFDLSEPEKLKLPVKKGAVTLHSFRIVADTAMLEVFVDKDALISEKFNIFGVRQALIDSDGKDVGRPGQTGGSTGDAIGVKPTYVLRGAKPAKLIVWHATKGHHVSIPFEFKDIEIPRASKKVEFAQPAPGEF